MKQVLAAIDFSEVSKPVMERATGLARVFKAKLTLLHVAASDPEFVGYDAGPQVVRDNRADQLRAEHHQLQQHAEQLRAEGIEAEALLVEGPTIETILEKARDLPADLVVIGSHGKGALKSALLGSVSQGVLRRAPCPLLVIPLAKDEPHETPA